MMPVSGPKVCGRWVVVCEPISISVLSFDQAEQLEIPMVKYDFSKYIPTGNGFQPKLPKGKLAF